MGDMTEPATTISFGVESDYEHPIGDKECGVSWCGGTSYPKPCDLTPDCPGLVHANYIEESWDGYQLDTKCDVCGESE